MNERERELVGEGYRLMDLKRWGKGVKRGKPQSKGLVLFPGQASTDGLDKPVDDQRMLWPIPKQKWMPTLNWQVSKIRDINQ